MSEDPKRSASEALLALEKSALRDEGERVAKLGDPELDASLAARGVDAAAARARGAELAARLMAQRAAAAKAPTQTQSETQTRPRAPEVVSLSAERAKRARPVVATWLAAAAVAAVVLGGGGAAYVALRTPEPVPTTPVPSVPTVPSGPAPEVLAKQDADRLRGQAATECGTRRWEACVALLGKARALDPEGDKARPVARMEAKAARAMFEEELDAKGGSGGARSLAKALAPDFVAALAKRGGQAIALACAPGREPQRLCDELAAALTKAGWVVTRPSLKEPMSVGGQVVHRVEVQVATDADDATQDAADALSEALERALVRTTGPEDAPAGSAAPLTLIVGPP